MFHMFIVTVMFAALAGCTSADSATKALQASGYTDVHITGYRFFGCGEDDWFRTGFRAKGANGQPIEGVVCGGLLFKGNTIRVE